MKQKSNKIQQEAHISTHTHCQRVYVCCRVQGMKKCATMLATFFKEDNFCPIFSTRLVCVRAPFTHKTYLAMIFYIDFAWCLLSCACVLGYVRVHAHAYYVPRTDVICNILLD